MLFVLLLINSQLVQSQSSELEQNTLDGTIDTLDEFQKQLNVDAVNSDFLSETKDYYGPKNILNRYDFVIVGASPSGCVLANRLSENADWKILLIEAGERENLLVRVPVFAAYMQSTSYNWGYLAEPQNYSCWGMRYF